MAGGDLRTPIPSQGATTTNHISSNPERQALPHVDLQTQVAQHMTVIQSGLNRLVQEIEGMPKRILEGVARCSAEGGVPQQPIPPPGNNAAPVAELQRELDAVHRELKIVQGNVSIVESQLRESQEEVNKLRRKEAMFRTMILDQAGVQEITDDEFLSRFLKLRQDVQKISHSSACAIDTVPVFSATDEETQPWLKAFYSPAVWEMFGAADRRLRLRAKIFEVLHYDILDYECFGLQDVVISDGNKKVFIEPGLRRFERMLKDCGVRNSVIRDWTISTINCVESAGIQETNTERISDYILSFLAPLLSKHTRPSEADALRANVLELCKDAFKLRMLMRKSKNQYVVETINSGTTVLLSAFETKAESVAVEGGKNSEKCDEIGYVVFGALVKGPQAGDQPVKVLEKAQVVLKKE